MKEIYQILSSEQNKDLQLSQIANNLANVNTIGFKRDGASFGQYLDASLNQAQGAAANPATPVWPGALTTYTVYQSGSFQNTGQKLDVAIDGEGFFKVRAPQGDFYSRAGNFSLNAKNELVNAAGCHVLDTSNNPITLDLSKGTPEITTEGDIKQKQATVARIGLVQFSDTRKLEKIGAGLFSAPAEAVAKPVAKPQIRQGMLESSNVNVIEEMTRMIDSQRAVDVNQKVVQSIDDLVSQLIQSSRS